MLALAVPFVSAVEHMASFVRFNLIFPCAFLHLKSSRQLTLPGAIQKWLTWCVRHAHLKTDEQKWRSGCNTQKQFLVFIIECVLWLPQSTDGCKILTNRCWWVMFAFAFTNVKNTNVHQAKFSPGLLPAAQLNFWKNAWITVSCVLCVEGSVTFFHKTTGQSCFVLSLRTQFTDEAVSLGLHPTQSLSFKWKQFLEVEGWRWHWGGTQVQIMWMLLLPNGQLCFDLGQSHFCQPLCAGSAIFRSRSVKFWATPWQCKCMDPVLCGVWQAVVVSHIWIQTHKIDHCLQMCRRWWDFFETTFLFGKIWWQLPFWLIVKIVSLSDGQLHLNFPTLPGPCNGHFSGFLQNFPPVNTECMTIHCMWLAGNEKCLAIHPQDDKCCCPVCPKVAVQTMWQISEGTKWPWLNWIVARNFEPKSEESRMTEKPKKVANFFQAKESNESKIPFWRKNSHGQSEHQKSVWVNNAKKSEQVCVCVAIFCFALVQNRSGWQAFNVDTKTCTLITHWVPLGCTKVNLIQCRQLSMPVMKHCNDGLSVICIKMNNTQIWHFLFVWRLSLWGIHSSEEPLMKGRVR